MQKMSKKVKDKWLKALRSGKYKQGRNILRSADNKFCCLGVLLDVQSPEGWRNLPVEEDPNRAYCHRNSEPSGGGAGLMLKPDLYGIHPRIAEELADMNDIKRENFGQIADWIEEHL